MSEHISHFAVAAGEGRSMRTMINAPVTIKADTRNTGGSLTALEFVHAPHEGPPLHVHHREDELWYVLDGDYRFKAGNSMFRLSTGGMAFVPRGTPHCFQNVGDTPGRMLIVFTPSGMERFFEQYASLLQGPVDSQQLTAVADANWMEFLGPPLAESDPL
jgi:mannose-6-phosphate isomerase-like protein (cupin superfamily)